MSSRGMPAYSPERLLTNEAAVFADLRASSEAGLAGVLVMLVALTAWVLARFAGAWTANLKKSVRPACFALRFLELEWDYWLGQPY